MIKIKSVYSVKESERTKLSKLHLTYGEMWPAFKYERNARNSKAKVSLLTYRSKIVGWGILFYDYYADAIEDSGWFFYNNSSIPRILKDKNNIGHIFVYVHPDHRCKGYGRKIVNSLKREHKKKHKDPPVVYEHDNVSKVFYKKIKSVIKFKC